MNYFLKKKKWLAWVIMLTFLFTSILPSNIMAGNSMAEAAESDQIVNNGSISYYKGTGTGTDAIAGSGTETCLLYTSPSPRDRG